ncbi:hypothetical protein UNDKW_4211 [Undibacterium sp. KW1]|nr:hypothetical protein UNDKW_4211 [Undibacterium sp. KW1]
MLHLWAGEKGGFHGVEQIHAFVFHLHFDDDSQRVAHCIGAQLRAVAFYDLVITEALQAAVYCGGGEINPFSTLPLKGRG